MKESAHNCFSFNLHVDIEKIETEEEWAQLYGWSGGETETGRNLSRHYLARVKVNSYSQGRRPFFPG
ncbi:MAG: hypothetical protein HDR90_04460 [Bacteroides sp.]|nr:hypothetical protein [Bacteroides sp.]MBD5343446.1 hypothetical protein [Bacteroides sp.]MBD5344234.1 hypothetical protein [Bacteroides sp.]